MKRIKLGEICDLKSGYAFKSSDYVEKSNTLNCRMSNIRPGAIFDIGYNIKYLPDEYADKYKDFLLYDDDIIIAMTDLAGDPKILGVPAKVITNGYNILQNQRVGKLIIKDKNKIDFNFLKYALSNPKNKEYYKKFAGGGLQINISNKDVLNIQISIYDKQEQIEIANKLNKVQETIDIRKKQIEELDKLIKSKFVKMFDGVENKVKLGECCDVHARIGWQALTKSEHLDDGDYMLITGTDFKNNEINYETCVYVTKERYEMDKHIILRNNDILITKDGTIGKVAIVHELKQPATLNSGIFVVRPDNRFNKEYIAYVFKGPLFEDFVDKSKTGATIKHLNQKHLVEFEIPLPSIELQNKFANLYKEIDKQKFEIQKSLDEMQKLQESLMNKYFN